MTTLRYILRDTWRLIVHHWVLGLLTLDFGCYYAVVVKS